MNQPIKPGKLINDRYLVKLILGQGRFNRTYLVEDTHRFNEPCVVKEFAPQILYNLYHPQLANLGKFFEHPRKIPIPFFWFKIT